MSLSQKKVLVILQHIVHIRNFLTSGFIDRVAATARVCVVLPKEYESAIQGSLRQKVEIRYLDEYQGGKLKHWFLASARMGSIIKRRKWNNTYWKKFVAYRRSPRSALKSYTLWFLSFFCDLEKVSRGLERLFPVQKHAMRLIELFVPEVLFSPTVIHETMDVELIKAAQQKNIPVVQFVDSWDNLTSKGFFIIYPDLLLVWGNADKESALADHGFQHTHVVVTGNAHFDQYFSSPAGQQRDQFLRDRNIDPRKKIVLFAGTTFSKYASEPILLEKISTYFAARKEVLIWYRPHPRAVRKEYLDRFKAIPNIFIDDQIIQSFQKTKTGFSVEKAYFEQYPKIVHACIGAISIFSTMVIEFALLKKSSILVDFKINADGSEIVEDATKVSTNAHLQEVLHWPGVVLVEDFNSLIANIETMLAGGFVSYGECLQKNAERIAFNIDGKGQERILAALLSVAKR